MSVMAIPARGASWRTKSTLPGFGLSLGFTLFYLSALVLIPLAALVVRPWSLGISGVVDELLQPRVLHALELSFGAAAIAAVVNTIFGLAVSWILVRYRFPGQRFIDALVDLPFALPTAVAGIALATLYSQNGWLGGPLGLLGVRVAYTPLGVLMALIFIGLPFVVRTLEPVLADAGLEGEEAAATLGATRFQAFRRVVLPALTPALLTGASLAFARAVGEYGSVIFIAGNLPMRSEIAPLMIVIKLEQFDYAGAAAIGVAMLGISFAMLFVLNSLQTWIQTKR
jgi:sulfate/thiosulfate transport system permease protein